MNKPTLILLFDANDCIFTKALCEKRQGNSTETWTYTLDDLFISHLKLWGPISEETSELKPGKIEILSASRRLSPLFDKKESEANLTGLFLPVLSQITELLNQVIPIDVTLDKISFLDLIGNSKIGDEFETRSQHSPFHHTEKGQEQLYEYLESKFILIYALLQYVAQKHPNQSNIKVLYFNSQMDHLNRLHFEIEEFENKLTYIIPKNIELSLYHYNGKEKAKKRQTISGKGNVNESLSETLNEIILKIATFNDELTNPCNAIYAQPVDNVYDIFDHIIKKIHQSHSDGTTVPHFFEQEEPSKHANFIGYTSLTRCDLDDVNEDSIKMNTHSKFVQNPRQPHTFSPIMSSEKILHTDLESSNTPANHKETHLLYEPNQNTATCITEASHIDNPLQSLTCPPLHTQTKNDHKQLSSAKASQNHRHVHFFENAPTPTQPASQDDLDSSKPIQIAKTEKINIHCCWC